MLFAAAGILALAALASLSSAASDACARAFSQADPENANVYVGNLAPDVTDAELQQHVSQFGTVLDVKIYRKGGYAFAQFASHAEAVRAIVGLSGQNLGGKALKCSWGRHQARKGGGAGQVLTLSCVLLVIGLWAVVLGLTAIIRTSHSLCRDVPRLRVYHICKLCSDCVVLQVQFIVESISSLCVLEQSHQHPDANQGITLPIALIDRPLQDSILQYPQVSMDPSSFEYLALQQQQQQQQMSLQQQLAMQQLGYAPAGYGAQVCTHMLMFIVVRAPLGGGAPSVTVSLLR